MLFRLMLISLCQLGNICLEYKIVKQFFIKIKDGICFYVMEWDLGCRVEHKKSRMTTTYSNAVGEKNAWSWFYVVSRLNHKSANYI